jgi:hypothetical protein
MREYLRERKRANADRHCPPEQGGVKPLGGRLTLEMIEKEPGGNNRIFVKRLAW